MNLQIFARDFPELLERVVGTHPVHAHALALAGVRLRNCDFAYARTHWCRQRAVAADVRKMRIGDRLPAKHTGTRSRRRLTRTARISVWPDGKCVHYVRIPDELQVKRFVGHVVCRTVRIREYTYNISTVQFNHDSYYSAKYLTLCSFLPPGLLVRSEIKSELLSVRHISHRLCRRDYFALCLCSRHTYYLLVHIGEDPIDAPYDVRMPTAMPSSWREFVGEYRCWPCRCVGWSSARPWPGRLAVGLT
jgi:hypothetical protein